MIDYKKMARHSKSHGPEELEEAVVNGDAVWELDSLSSGNDDLLVYPKECSEDEIQGELLEWFQLGPHHGQGSDSRNPFDHEHSTNCWTLKRVSTEDMAEWWPLEDED